MGGLGHTSLSPAVASDGAGQARKRNMAMAGLDSSPGSMDDVEEIENRDEKRRQPVKRACNECRQQKVRLPLSPPSYSAHGVDRLTCSCFEAAV